MARVWVTCGTPTIPAVVNTLTAACDSGYVPDTLHLLSNPGVAAAVDRILPMCETVVAEYGGDLDVQRTGLDSERFSYITGEVIVSTAGWTSRDGNAIFGECGRPAESVDLVTVGRSEVFGTGQVPARLRRRFGPLAYNSITGGIAPAACVCG